MTQQVPPDVFLRWMLRISQYAHVTSHISISHSHWDKDTRVRTARRRRHYKHPVPPFPSEFVVCARLVLSLILLPLSSLLTSTPVINQLVTSPGRHTCHPLAHHLPTTSYRPSDRGGTKDYVVFQNLLFPATLTC